MTGNQASANPETSIDDLKCRILTTYIVTSRDKSLANELDALSAFKRLKATSFEIRGQNFPSTALSRTPIRVCCNCIIADMSNCSVPEGVRPFRRSVWLIRDIQTCPVHRCALTDLPQSANQASRHDFVAQLSPFLPHIHERAAEITMRAPTAFEIYAFTRFYENTPNSSGWLDQFSIYEAGKICLMFGATEAFGAKINISSLDNDDRRKSQSNGFKIASGGESEIRRMLADLHGRRGTIKRSAGPLTHFDSLYSWLRHGTQAPQYQPLRKIIAEYCFDTLPDQTQVLGFERPNPKLLSVHSAALTGC